MNRSIAVALIVVATLLGGSFAAPAAELSADELKALGASMEVKKRDMVFWNSPQADESHFVALPDDVRIALSFYYPKNFDRMHDKAPAIFVDTVYGRAEEASVTAIDLYRAAGFVVVIGDARGFGASFGAARGFNTRQQTQDEANIIRWISEQNWSDGNVAAVGHSVSAVFADSMTASGAPALKAAIIRAEDFDEYSLNMFPGGVPNLGILELATGLMEWHAGAPCLEKLSACSELGFPGVDEDKDFTLLQSAMRDHQANLKVESFAALAFRDDMLGSAGIVEAGPISRVTEIRRANLPTRISASWMDGTTAVGALDRYSMVNSAPMEVVIGATTHPGGLDADPFSQKPFQVARPSAEEQFAGDVAFLKRVLSGGKIARSVRYVVLGTDQWKTTAVWPPSGVQDQTLALGPSKLVSEETENGVITYQVDPTVSSGPLNRWGAQRGKPVFYGDRRLAPGKRLVFEGEPFAHDMELVGTPELCLVLSSDQPDGLVAAHIEDVAPDGRVTHLTEGLLRLLDRKTEGKLCDPSQGVKRSFNRADSSPVVPGQNMEIELPFLPVAALVKSGHHIRLSLAGADAGNFPTLTGDNNALWTISYGGANSSRLSLPLKPWLVD